MSQPKSEEPLRVGDELDIRGIKAAIDAVRRHGAEGPYEIVSTPIIIGRLDWTELIPLGIRRAVADLRYPTGKLHVAPLSEEPTSAAQQEIARLKSELDIMRQHRDDARFKLQRFRDECAADCL